MKPKNGVPQLWYLLNDVTNKDAVRIVNPDGSVEVYGIHDTQWELSFLSGKNQKDAVGNLVDFGHEFVCNLE